jgi:hypothetical protein
MTSGPIRRLRKPRYYSLSWGPRYSASPQSGMSDLSCRMSFMRASGLTIVSCDADIVKPPLAARQRGRTIMQSTIDAIGETAQRQRVLAIILMCLAVLSFSVLDANVKWLAATFATAQIVFMRFFVHWMASFTLVPPQRLPELWRTRRFGMQLLRASLLVATTTFNFLAVRYLQLSETVSIFFAAPLLVALLAGPILGEWVGPRRLIAIIVGFCGVLVVMRPGLGGLPWQAIYSVGAVTTYAMLSIVTRIIAPTEPAYTAHFYTGLLARQCFCHWRFRPG